jgi:HAD superfamily 5'-nucleotidase-like hydrolase
MTSSLPTPFDPAASEPPPEYRTPHASSAGGIARESRIFVNRNLRMSSIGAIGFDLDYTLAHYQLWEIDDLAFRITQDKLVTKRGHPEEILDIPFDPDFVVRGLVIDRRRGNILKMDYHNYVVRAFHGRKPLTAAERKKAYRMRRIRTSGEAYVSVDTLFHLPEVYLYLALVDFYEERGGGCDFRRLYQDVRDMIDEAHADGSIKGEIQKDPARFVSRDPRLPEFLQALRDGGKKVFLLTNSEYYYTDILLSFLLGGPGLPPWRTYFDVIAVDSDKPSFFLEKDGRGRHLPLSGPGAPVFRGGDVWAFEDILGFAGDSILYWGDHTYGDILRSKKSVGWRTAMIIPELETEIMTTNRIASELTRLQKAIEARDRLGQEEQMTRVKLKRLEELAEGAESQAPQLQLDVLRQAKSLQSRLEVVEREKKMRHQLVAELDEDCNRAHNRYWGMLFREANEITRFGHQVKDFACIYTSRVSNFLYYPLNTYFRAPIDRLPHEL